MSIIHPNTIKAIAQSVDIPKLSDEAAKTLAPDVEYRLREVVQVPTRAENSSLPVATATASEPWLSRCLCCMLLALTPTGGAQVCKARQAHKAHNRGYQ
jgi:hypothetical protein